MNFIFLNDIETKVLKLYSKGKTYEDISVMLNMSKVEALAHYMKGLDKIRAKNKLLQTEKKIQEVFKVTFVILLCFLPQKRARNTKSKARTQICRIARVRREKRV